MKLANLSGEWSNSSIVLRNMLFQFGATLVNRICLFLFTIVAARMLGPAGWGQLAFAIAVLFVLRFAVDFGFQTLTTREVASRPHVVHGYFWNGILFKFILALVLIPITIFCLQLLGFREETVRTTRVVLLSLLPYTLYTSMLAVFDGLERMEFTALLKISLGVSYLITLGSLLLFAQVKPLNFGLVFLLSTLISVMLGGLLITRTIGLNPAVSLRLIRETVRLAFPFALISVITFMFQKVDLPLLSRLEDDGTVGVFSAAHNILDAVSLLPQAFVLGAFPYFSRLALNSPVQLAKIYAIILKYSLGLLIAATGAIYVFSDDLIRLLYGSGYDGGSQILRILIWAGLFMSTNAISGYVLFSLRQQKYLIGISLMNLVLIIGLNLVLIPLHGGDGSAIAKVITFFASFVFHLMAVKRFLDVSTTVPDILLSITPLPLYLLFLMALKNLFGIISLPLGITAYVLFWHAIQLRGTKELRQLQAGILVMMRGIVKKST
jgi:O-antigen/teichoic acid export membrane protein